MESRKCSAMRSWGRGHWGEEREPRNRWGPRGKERSIPGIRNPETIPDSSLPPTFHHLHSHWFCFLAPFFSIYFLGVNNPWARPPHKAKCSSPDWSSAGKAVARVPTWLPQRPLRRAVGNLREAACTGRAAQDRDTQGSSWSRTLKA